VVVQTRTHHKLDPNHKYDFAEMQKCCI